MRFIQNCKTEISVTVWGIIRINKNVIPLFSGKIVTYNLLFENVDIIEFSYTFSICMAHIKKAASGQCSALFVPFEIY